MNMSLTSPLLNPYFLSNPSCKNPAFSKTLCEALFSTSTKDSSLTKYGNSLNTVERVIFKAAVTIPCPQYSQPNAYAKWARHRSSPDSGLTEMYPMDRSSKHMDRRQGWGIDTSVRYLTASSREVMVFHLRYRVTLSSPAHDIKSAASESDVARLRRIK